MSLFPNWDPTHSEFLRVKGLGDKAALKVTSHATREDFKEGIQDIANFVLQHDEYLKVWTPGLERFKNTLEVYENHVDIDTYYAIMTRIKKLRTKEKSHIFEDSVPEFTKINNKLFGFIHGDKYLESSGLEGGQLASNIKFLLPYLEKKLSGKHDELFALLEEYLRFDHSAPKLWRYDSHARREVTVHAKDIAERVENLEEGGKLMLNGGWSGTPSGHAMIYLVSKNKGQYEFTVMNTGGGIRFHKSKLIGGKRKYSPMIRITNIPEDRITSSDFYKALLELEFSQDKNDNLYQHSAKDIYERILPALGGDIEEISMKDEDLITAQRSGTCSWKVIIKMLMLEMADKRDYKHLMYEMKHDSLAAFVARCEYWEKEGRLTDEEVLLLQRNTETFARSVEKQYRNGVISEDEYEKSRDLISSRIQPYIKVQQVRRKRYSQDLEIPHVVESEKIPVSPLKEHDPNPSIGSSRSTILTTPKTYDDFFNLLLETNRTYNLLHAGDVRGAMSLIESTVEALPTVDEDSQWEVLFKGIPDANAFNEIMIKFQELQLLYINCVAKLPPYLRGTPDQLALSTTLCAMGSLTLYNMRPDVNDHIKKGDCLLNDFNVGITSIDVSGSRFNWKYYPYMLGGNNRMMDHLEKSLSYFKQVSRGKNVFGFGDTSCIRLKGNKLVNRLDDIKPDARLGIKEGLGVIVKSDEFKRQWESTFTEDKFEDYSEGDHAAHALSHQDDLLPVYFRAQLQNILLNNFFYRNPGLEYTDDSLDYWSDWGVGEFSDAQYDEDGEEIRFDVIVKGLSLPEWYGEDAMIPSPFPIINDKQESIWKVLNKGHYSEDLWSNDVNNAVCQRAVGSLSEKETQELGYIASRSNCAIPALMSYLKERPELFNDPDYYAFITSIFLSGHQLEDFARDSPLGLDFLTKFLEENYQIHRDFGHIDAQILIIKLMNQVSKRVGVDWKLGAVSDLCDELLVSCDEKDRDLLCQIHALNIGSFVNKRVLEEDDFEKIAKSYVYIQLNREKDPPLMMIDDMQKVMARFFENFQERGVDDQNRLGLNLMKHFFEDVTGPCERKGPLLQQESGPYAIDMEALTIYREGKIIGPLPEFLRSHATMKHLFEDPETQLMFSGEKVAIDSLKPGMLEFRAHEKSSPDEYDYQILVSDETSELIVKKKIGGEWYTKFNPFDSELKEFRKFCKDHDFWMHWDEGEPHGQMIVMDKKGECIAVGRIQEEEGGEKVMTLVRYHPGENDHEAPLVKMDSSLYKTLENLQPKKWVTIWGDRSIELPGLGIRLESLEGKWVLSSDHTAQVSSRQRSPRSLPTFKGFLRINQNEQVRFLIPRRQLDIASQKGAFKRADQLKFDRDDTRFFTFDQMQGELIGTTNEENLYLGYLHFAQKNYAKAFHFLQQIYSANPKGFTKSEMEILSWIDKLIEKSPDPTPESLAIQLRMMTLKNRFHEKKPDAKTISSLLEKYYDVAHHAKDTRLTLLEEAELLNFVLESGKLLREVSQLRYAFLKQGDPHLFPSKITPSADSDQEERIVIRMDPKKVDRHLDQLMNKKTRFARPKYRKPYYCSTDYSLIKGFERLMEDVLSEDPKVRQKVRLKLSLMNVIAYRQVRDFMVGLTELDDDIIKTFSKDYEDAKNGKHVPKYTQIIKAVCQKHNDEIPKGAKAKKKETPIKFEGPVFKKRQIKPIPLSSSHELVTASPKSGPLKKSGISLTSEIKYHDQVHSKHLQDLFAVDTRDTSVVQNEMNRLSESVRLNDAELNASKIVQLSDDDLSNLDEWCQDYLNKMSGEMEDLKNQILCFANQMPEDPQKARERELGIVGGWQKELTLDQLIIAYLQNNGSVIREGNPTLDKRKLMKLTDDIVNYLTMKTEWNHFANIQKTASKAYAETGKIKREVMLQNLSNLIKEKRHYKDPNVDRALLVFEYYSGFRLRKKQVKTIRAMCATGDEVAQNLIMQLLMGSGKSKVILPILAYSLSDGKRIPMILVPDELFETNLADMQEFSREFLHQEIETIILPEGKRPELSELKDILVKFDRIKENRSYCMLKTTTAHSLRLQFKETLLEFSKEKKGTKANRELQEKVDTLRKILNLMRNEAAAILDEADMILNCTKEVNFASPLEIPLNESTLDEVSSLFEVMSSKEYLDFFNLDRDLDAVFDLETYESEIKPKLIETVLNRHGLDATPSVIAYMNRGDSVTEIPSEIRESDVRDQIALSREILNNLIPLAFSKNCDEHFGLSKKSPKNLVIPYARSNVPNEGSEFGNAYETLIYSMLYYLRRGVTEQQAERIIQELKGEAFLEYQSGTPLQKSQAAKKFTEIYSISGKTLFNVTAGDIEAIKDEFNKTLENRMDFVQKFSWPEVKVKEESLTSNSQHLAGMFKSVMGFTGTLWNQETFHSSLQPRPEKALDGKTLQILARSESHVEVLSDENLYKNLDGYHACIDCGAWFRGQSAKSVAENILKQLDSDQFDGVIYFNDVDDPPGTYGRGVFLGRGEKAPVLLSDTKYEGEEYADRRFTLYNITTGADVVQNPSAKALTTIGKNVTTRDLLQGVWRMRGLDDKQSVDFAIPEDLRKTLKDVDLDSVLVMCARNQGVRKERDNLRAFKQKVNWVLDHSIENVLLDPNLDEEIIRKFVEALTRQGLYSRKQGDLPFASFGCIEKEIDRELFCEQYIKKTLEKVDDLLLEVPEVFFFFDTDSLEDEMEKLVDLETLPDKVVDPQAATEMEVQVEESVEQEAQVEMDVTQEYQDMEFSTSEADRLSGDFLQLSEYDLKIKQELNRYLDLQKSMLTFQGKSPFSGRICVTKNFAQHKFDFDEDKKWNHLGIPFGRGSKPVGICACYVNDKGEYVFTFLSANEAEFLQKQLAFIHGGHDLRKIARDELEFYVEILNKILKEKGLEPFAVDLDASIDGAFKHREGIRGFVRDEFKKKCSFSEDESNAVIKKYYNNAWSTLGLAYDKYGYEFQEIKNLMLSPSYHKVYLVDPQLGVLNTNQDMDSIESVTSDSKYIEFITQTKFYKGLLFDYTVDEQKYLRTWIAEYGSDEMEQYLLKNILAFDLEKQRKYPGSMLHCVFEQVRAGEGSSRG
ncbi:MAG: hypothetical protein K940chlam3_00896 [Chlamydiae bacterium]|nr:hypothetical protein [Chlamydiota bacterium]